MPDRPQTRQKAKAGHHAYVAGGDLIINDAGASAVELGVPGLLPRDVPGFTGRDDELARLAALAGGGRVVVSAIGGTAGVGKTALAVHAAYRLLDEFPDGHLYADLRGYTDGQDPAEVGEVLEVFLRCLGVPAEEVPAGVEERSGLLRQILAARRVLMVLDNARAEAQVRPLLPGAGGSLVLVTSRSVLLGLEADERISLDVLAEDEAAAMLTGLIGAVRGAADPVAVGEVARLCGRLPLALRIAGQMLAAHPAWPVIKLVQMLASEQDRLARFSAGDLKVRAAFEVSYRQLGEGDARLFRLLGLHPGPHFTVSAAAALAGTDYEAAVAALGRLVEAHLVTEDTVGRLGMHDLLRLFARATCEQADTPADREAAETVLVDYYVDLAGFLDSCVDPQLRPAAEQADTPLPSMRQALAAFQAERPCLLAALGLAIQQGRDEQVCRLSMNMGDSLQILRYLDDLLTVMEAALAAARHAGNPLTEGGTLHNLGEAYQELGRFEEAITSYQQALAIFRDIGDRSREGMTLNNLGTALDDVGQVEEAITSYQQALAIFRDTGDRHREGWALNNLGQTYSGLRRFEDAITSLQQDIEICRETGDPHGEGITLDNLGSAYQGLRRFEDAITSHLQALVMLRDTGDRHREGITLGHLGNAYQAMRQPDRAAACRREAAAIMRDVGDHERAEILERLAGNTQTRRRRWRWRTRRSSEI
jgi:tetratricopeptide (TPR) repeat protein